MRIVVGIPARDEAARIADCVRALAGGEALPDAVLVLVNNARDDTATVLRDLAPALPFALHVQEEELRLPSAGAARSLVMDRAAAMAGPGGLLLTTDADGRVAPDWLRRTMRAVATGAEAVMGRALIDPVEARALPPRLHEDDARECRFAALLDLLAAVLDPDEFDPWPRHDEESGASMAVTTEAYGRAGGMPCIPTGEDRAFAVALRSVDARIRHEPGVTVTVSGRLIGRAAGGMADTMRRRLAAPDPFLDGKLEPTADRVRRLRLRRALRDAWLDGSAEPGLAQALGIQPAALATALDETHFGAAWRRVEILAPTLIARPVPAAAVLAETAAAEAELQRLTATASA